ncbi:MAG: cation diffusion facilitator family transporter [Mycoplasmatales bacterium]
MPHNHAHHHGTELEQASKVSILLNILFVIIEIIGGLYTNSISILSDAVHDFGDVITLSISFVLIKISKKEKTEEYNFGFKGLIIIGAILNTLIILSTSSLILIKSLSRIANPQIINGKVMFLIAIFGVILNSVSVYKFHNQKNVMSRSLMLHLLEDALGWVAILISSVVIMIFKIYIIDTLLSIGISLFLVINAIRNIKNIINVMLYKVPQKIKIQEVKQSILQIKNVKIIEDLKIWSIEGETIYCLLKVKLTNNLQNQEIEAIKVKIKESLKLYDIKNVTLETKLKD